MNKTTTLVLAAIAGFGLSAQAKQQTDTLWDVGFDAITISADKVPLSEVTNDVSFTTYGKWDLSSEDNESYVTNGLVGSSSSQFLVLDTNGNELKWTPDQTGTGTVSIVESDIYFVGADDAPPPEGFDSVSNPAQTAMYLKNVYEDGEGVTQDEPQSYELYIWTWSETLNTNAWQKLDSAVTNENWHHVQILIDYEKSTPKVSVAVNGIVAADPSDPTVTSWTAASRGGGKTAVQTVSFKGTGRVDNFVGRSRVTSFDKAFFGAEVYVDGVKQPVGSEGNTTRYTAEKQEIGDVDNESKSVTFSQFAFDNFESDDEPIALSRITIITNGIETVYDYSGYYDSENGVFTGVPDGYPAEFALDKSGDQTGKFSISPLTHGATKGDVTNIVAKIYINTLDAYFASAAVNVGEDSATYEKFVKPSDAGKTVSWTFPNTTNGTYVLRSVVVANGATFDSSTGVVSFEVPGGGIGSDKTYATVTYVEGGYDAEALEWVYDSSTGTYTLQRKTFTVTWVNGEDTVVTNGVAYGDVPEYYGETPTKASTAQYDYAFAGWTPAVIAATSNATYNASFTETVRSYDITWVADGNANQVTSVAYGDTPVAPEVTAPQGKVLDGWTPAIVAVTGATTYTAVFVDAAPDVATVITITDAGATTNEVPYKSLAAAVEAAPSGATVVLNDNIALASMVVVGDNKAITLDLNGKTISAADAWVAGATKGDCLLCVSYTGSLVIEDSSDPSTGAIDATNPAANLYGAVKITHYGETAGENKVAALVVNGGTITGISAGICGNGTRSGSSITVNGGSIAATADDGNGIFHPQGGTLAINGGVISGATAVYLKSGALAVTGGTLTGTGAKTAYKPTGNGGNPTGDALVIDTCGYPGGNPTASITGGTFVSQNAKSVGSYASGTDSTTQEAREPLADFIPATVGGLPNPARFSDAKADGVPVGYELVAVEGTDPVLYEVSALAPIQWLNTWTANSIYYFDDEDPIPARSTQATVPKYKRAGASSYVAVVPGDGITVTWTVTTTAATTNVADGVTCASVDGSGLVTFTEPGSVKLWVQLTDPAGSFRVQSKTVKYAPAPVYTVSADGQTKTAYASLYAAFNKAQDGETVVLGQDASGANLAKMTLAADKAITLDLNGHTFTFSQNYREGAFGAFMTVKKGSLTVVDTAETKGGIVVSGTNARAFTVDGTANAAATDAVLTIGEGVNVSSADECCAVVIGKATLNTAGNLSSPADFAIAGNGSAGNGGTVINVTGGTVAGDEVAIYHPQDGTLTISGGTITGDTAVYVKSGTVSVTGGTLAGTGTAADYTYNGNGANATGDALVVENCGYPGGTPVVSITGGTFTSANAKSVSSYAYGTDSTTQEDREPLDDFIPATVGGQPNPARFSDAESDGVPEGYGLKETEPGSGVYAITKTYVVTYANYDGTALQVTTNFVGDATPAYAGETPVKDSDSQYDYSFTGWSPAVAATVTEDATYVAQFSATENGTVIVITDAGATTNYFATLQAALDSVKENNLQQANIELLADASIEISRNGNVLGGDAATKITIKGNGNTLNVVRNGTWAQFNTANGATLVLEDVDLTSEFTGTQTGWVGDTLQNPNHNIAFNCDVELKDVDSDTALSFWKDADLDTVTIAETVDVYSIWIHTTASNVAIKDLVVDSPNGRGIKVDDSFVKYAGTPSASTAISIDGASFTTKNRKSAVLVRSAYPIDITTAGTIDISNVPADTQHLVWVDVDASENFGLVTFNGAQSGLGVEGGASSYAASLTTNAWIAGYYKVLADAVKVATADDTVTLLKDSAETFTVSKELTITRNGFSAENVTAGDGWQRTDTDAAYVFAEESQEEEHKGAIDGEGFVILDPEDPDNTEDKPLTFTSISPTGTATISAAMLNPNGSTSVQLQVVYRTSLTGDDLYLPATVSNIDVANGTATVTWTQPNVDTFFLIGLANKVNVDDPEP